MKFIHLTIDGGPSRLTGKLLNYLEERQFGAILFCVGKRLRERPDMATRAICKGFIIGNHSYDHRDFNKLSASEVQEQIKSTDEIIHELYTMAKLPRPAKYFRFPYGHMGADAEAKKSNQELLRKLGYFAPLHNSSTDWRWDVEVDDWDVHVWNVGKKMLLAKKRLKQLHPDCVLDLHDYETNLRWRVFRTLCEAVIDLGFGFCKNEYPNRQAANAKWWIRYD